MVCVDYFQKLNKFATLIFIPNLFKVHLGNLIIFTKFSLMHGDLTRYMENVFVKNVCVLFFEVFYQGLNKK